MSECHAVLLTLGSNIERHKNMPLAIEALRQHLHIKLCAVSPMYESLPVGNDINDINQPIYSNAAVWIESELDPSTLKAHLRQIEADLGRVRSANKFAARPIDIDIAFYGQQIFELDGNHIPDPDIARYPHIALPLADIAPDWVHPELGVPLRHIADHLNYNKSEIYQL
ncbi:MAG: 2-amino-4-hydroxy-6-hydroxymethyldihydropteridine diphosphokinase [Ardenticatenaceae bacterium]